MTRDTVHLADQDLTRSDLCLGKQRKEHRECKGRNDRASHEVPSNRPECPFLARVLVAVGRPSWLRPKLARCARFADLTFDSSCCDEDFPVFDLRFWVFSDPVAMMREGSLAAQHLFCKIGKWQGGFLGGLAGGWRVHVE